MRPIRAAGRAIILTVVLVLGAVVVATGRAHDTPGAAWTVRQAESIRTIRSMAVHVLECRGLGKGITHGGPTRYRHFRCTAGTRAPWETYDTIAVLYVLHPLGRYLPHHRRFAATSVRFIGGPGIP